MTSNDGRREVAERLRMCARNTSGPYDFTMYLSYWVGIGDVTDDEGKHFSVAAERRRAKRTLEKLADLIDPTCYNKQIKNNRIAPAEFRNDNFICSACGEIFCADSEGINHPIDWAYCPNCGARIMEVADGV